MRWAVIGSGDVAVKAFQEITKTGRHRAVTIFSVDHYFANSFAAHFHAKRCNTVVDAIKHKDVEAVYVCTTVDAHYPLAIQAVRLGKPVLIESPVSINFAQLKELFMLAKEKNVYVCDASWLRFTPLLCSVRDLVVNDAIGKVQHIECYMGRTGRLLKRRKRFMDAEFGGGALMDAGVCLMSINEMLMGYPTAIKCTAKISRKYETDVMMDANFTYGSDSSAELFAVSRRASRAYLRVVGEYGTVSVPHLNKPHKAVIKINGYRQLMKKDFGFIYQFDKVAADIAAGKIMSEEVTWTSSMNILRIMDGCRIKTALRYSRQLETTRVATHG